MKGDRCKKPGHTKDTCWVIHGKPADWKPPRSRDSSANAATSEGDKVLTARAPESSPFNKEQMEMLQKMLQQTLQNTRTPSAATLANKHNPASAFLVKKGKSNSWIVGASDHMTRDITLFDEYSPCNDNSMVRIADGTDTKLIIKGSIIISKDITLNSVLYVPKLNCNLLSISKLTHDQNFVTKFLPHLCEFLDLDSRRKISNAKECAGLYLRVSGFKKGRNDSVHVAAPSGDNLEDNVML